MDELYKNKYDLIFSIGQACCCTESLRFSKLQFASYPFDWLWGMSFEDRVKMLCSNFDSWFCKEDFVFLSKRTAFQPNDIYKNTKTDITFNHDFPLDSDFNESYDAIKAKYDRRIKRLLTRIKESRRVLVVWLNFPNNNEIDDEKTIINGYNNIKNTFKSPSSPLKIDLLYICNDLNISFKEREIKTIYKDNDTKEFIKSAHFPYGYNDSSHKTGDIIQDNLRAFFFNVKISDKYQSFYNIISRLNYRRKFFFKYLKLK